MEKYGKIIPNFLIFIIFGIIIPYMDQFKRILSKSIVSLLGPLVRLMLRYEISHSEFNELSKRAYVQTANKHFLIPGRKATYSRVSVITGISRKEVVRLLELEQGEPPETKGPLNRGRRVIRGWLDDETFLDAQGEPRILPLRDASPCFEELAAKYSGDISGRAVLDELLRVGAVEKTDNSVRLLHQGFIPQADDGEKVSILTRHTHDLLNSCLHNIENHEDKRLQRQLTYYDLPESVATEFKQLSEEKSMQLLVELDKWLAEHKRNAAQEKTKLSRVGLGLYYFENKEEEE